MREPRSSSVSAELASATFESPDARYRAVRRLLQTDIWPKVPAEQRGKAPSKQEREQILGYGEEESP